MYFSSEEEINDNISDDDEETVNSIAAKKTNKPLINIDKLDLHINDKERISSERGVISLSFPDAAPSAFKSFLDNDVRNPTSYTSTTSKERLLLLLAENFRRQYNVAFERRPLVLAVPNQVCTIAASPLLLYN